MKRLLSIILLLVILFCPVARAESELDAFLISKARETTSVMRKMAGMDSLIGLYVSDSEILSRVRLIAEADCGQPESAVVLTATDECIASLLTLMQIDAPAGSDIFRVMKGKLYNTIPNILNARAGAVWLAMTSVLSVTDACLSETAFEGIAYVLFQYAGDMPDMICAFNINNGVAAIAGSYLDASAFASVDWSAGASDFLKSLAGTDLPMDVSGITITQYSAEEL